MEEQLVSKKIAERLAGLAGGQERNPRRIGAALNLQAAPPTRCDAVEDRTESRTERDRKKEALVTDSILYYIIFQ